MLKNITDKSAVVKQIAIRTANRSLEEFLTTLLAQWHYEVLPTGDPDVLLLAEQGCCVPVAGQSVVWLTPSADKGRDRLPLPLDVEDLWETLEQRFHRPPRRHIRKNVDITARMESGGAAHDVVLSSLSDMGCRFSFDRELARDETVRIEIPVGEGAVAIEGTVIYSFVEGGEFFRTGLVFHGIRQDLRVRLRDDLIIRYLEAVRENLPANSFREALEYIDLPAGVTRHFGPASS